MSPIALYDAVSGEIRAVVVTHDVSLYVGGPLAVLELPEPVDPDSYLVEAGAAVPKKALNVTPDRLILVADGVDAITFSVPVVAHVKVFGPLNASAPVTDGAFVFTTDLPGGYEIWFSHPHFLPSRFYANAT